MIPEKRLDDPSAIDPFGYAEAKWICERMFEEAGRVQGDRLVATNVRIGQMTGAEGTGAWNIAEHIPMIFKSCVAVGKMPALEGVSCSVQYVFSTSTDPLLHFRRHPGFQWIALQL
jgi:thioester reductase-like protein